eukprot:3729474-Alexandrium_andersonii.AAC.1
MGALRRLAWAQRRRARRPSAPEGGNLRRRPPGRRWGPARGPPPRGGCVPAVGNCSGLPTRLAQDVSGTH